MKKVMINTSKPKKSFKLTILVSSIGLLMLTSGCNHMRDISVIYTPLTETRQLVNSGDKQNVVIGSFIDARSHAELFHSGSGFNIHSYTWKTQNNIPDLVRGAFEDALLKTGFGVHKLNEIENKTLFTLTGKVLTYNITLSQDAVIPGFFQQLREATVTANVEVELLLKPKFGDSVTIVVKGAQTLDLYEPARKWSYDDYLKSSHLIAIDSYGTHINDKFRVYLNEQVRTECIIKALDAAMHDCVMDFQNNKEFLKLISK